MSGCGGYTDKIIAQTLFLGASVSSVNVNKGWSGQPSTLTVNLIEDNTPPPCVVGGKTHKQFPPPTGLQAATSFSARSYQDGYAPDHYHTCINDCYIDSLGNPIASDSDDPDAPPREQWMVPGKVFYQYMSGSNGSQAVYSRYWKNSDPGFFGVPNRIKIDGSYIDTYDPSNTSLNDPYDIIGTPVFFKMGELSFGGIVQSWNETISSGGRGYTVNINGMESILSQCYVVLNNFAGAIYSRSLSEDANPNYGGPRNYIGRDYVNYWGSIAEGNIPNVFNVYGFLESLGKGGFGGARLSEDGIKANDIVAALKVLTSADSRSESSLFANTSDAPEYSKFGPKSAFSPFGRILTKCMQVQDTYQPITNDFTAFGVIPPTPLKASDNQSSYCQFVLDLSELPEMPDTYRINGPVISILELIDQITEDAGYDYHVSFYPLSQTVAKEDSDGNVIKDSEGNIQYENVFINVIKVHTISRLSQPRPNIISNTIKKLQCDKFPISSINMGQELNETQAKYVLVGGKQQRLYQAKSLRLGYSQNSYILNPYNFKFVDYIYLGSIGFNNGPSRSNVGSEPYNHGKIKIPSLLSIDNPVVSDYQNPDLVDWYRHNRSISDQVDGVSFNDKDTSWNDNKQLAGSQDDLVSGNYKNSSIIQQDGTPSTWGVTTGKKERFFPIHMDVICPFFGYVLESEQSIDVSSEFNEFKRIRPVYFDTWTGQILVVLQMSELPITNLDLESFYSIRGKDAFVLAENEIRAAMAGFDNFLVYSLAKSYKSDIIEMVRRAYEQKYYIQYLSMGTMDSGAASTKAREKTDWYWRLIGGNIAGSFNQTIDLSPDKGDGTAAIEEDVIQDLQILHNFISQIGSQYYGKKYMVSAPGVRAYKDEQFADITLPTQAGDAYVFGGGGKMYYNYQPTNDGAWEEYGNIIDDTIVVGGTDWYNLTDDAGKIKPILGYNANYTFDHTRYELCRTTQAKVQEYIDNSSNDPFWNFDGYDYLMTLRDGTCDKGKFLFPGINLATLNSSEYIIKSVETYSNAESLLPYFGSGQSPNPWSYEPTATTSKDAWGEPITDVDSNPISLQKLYLNTSVEENFVFLDPIGLSGAKFLVDAPGITVNSSSESTAKDPNRTVISTIAAEDLAIYLHSVPAGNWDYEWIHFMMYYVSDIHRDANEAVNSDVDMIGSYAASANQASNFVEIAPKAIHPFFVGVPIRDNQYSYGPWTNYPYSNYENILPAGKQVTIGSDLSNLSCDETDITIDADTATRAMNNWILPTKVEINEDMVPWNYGGSATLDTAAFNEINSNLNYQSVIETAQIDIVGLPRFGLGMAFNYDALTPAIAALDLGSISYTDYKDNMEDTVGGAILDFSDSSSIATPTTVSTLLTYDIFVVEGVSNITDGPIITNIQTSIGQNGVTTTYTFRTYTPKVGLFNKIANDRLKKLAQTNMRRGKQLAKLDQQSKLTADIQSRFLQEQRLQNANLSSDYTTKLFGWSPSTVLIAQAHPYIPYPEREIEYIEPTGLFTQIEELDTNATPSPDQNPFKFTETSDQGTFRQSDTSYLTNELSAVKLAESLRYKTSTALYELKEVESQLKKDRGLQSVMSLDGLLSPVSFYPTLKNSTFSYGVYDTDSCPFCKATKKIRTNYAFRIVGGKTNREKGVLLFCDKCGRPSENPINTLKSTVTTSAGNQSIETLPPYVISSGTDIDILLQFKALAGSAGQAQSAASSASSSSAGAGVSIPINLVTLNPIVVPYGNLSNSNIQNYTSTHPEGDDVHSNLSIGVYSSSNPRKFVDRCRHSIEIVGRGATKPKNISIHNNLKTVKSNHQVDFYSKDVVLKAKIKENQGLDVDYQMNQRFVGLRGPVVMHGWGYDLEGYPVPNAADEPYEIDRYGRPRRFKIKIKKDYPKPTTYKALEVGAAFIYPTGDGINGPEYVKKNKPEINLSDDTGVLAIIYEDDYENGGGFMDDTAMYGNDRSVGYQGSIISKTQKWIATGATESSHPGIDATGGKWSDKKKLKEFYLNWAERPDIWPVGPIDLRWDESRRVWTMKSSEAATIYKMVYVTLEEDLVPMNGSPETYPARGFLDDIEYSTEPLDNGYRRLVYVKDRATYTAPRGAKLLCRYDKNSGFYEPVSKHTFVAKGTINPDSNTAAIEMSYAPGSKKGSGFSTVLVNFENPFGLSTTGGKGLFTYVNGKWTLTTGS